ncbi:MAG: hypothetical protein QM733_03385 [Ilumatobacteraceae bacterium]
MADQLAASADDAAESARELAARGHAGHFVLTIQQVVAFTGEPTIRYVAGTPLFEPVELPASSGGSAASCSSPARRACRRV